MPGHLDRTFGNKPLAASVKRRPGRSSGNSPPQTARNETNEVEP